MKEKTTLLIVLGISVFIINTIFRKSIAAIVNINSIYTSINILAILCLFGVLSLKSNNKHVYQVLISLGIIIFGVLAFFSNLYSSNNPNSILMLFTSLLPPMIIINMNLPKVNWIVAFRKFISYYNIIFSILFLIGITDFFVGGIVNLFIANYLSSDDWANMIIVENINSYRMCTILGSPLMNAFYALVMLCLNIYYTQLTKEVLYNKYLLYVISVVTIILTGSRYIFFMSILFIIITELRGGISTKHLVSLLVVPILLIALVNNSVFESTLGTRFEKNFDEDVRSTTYDDLRKGYYGDIPILLGGGYNYSRKLTSTKEYEQRNFENPFLMFMFDYGLLASVIYYIIMLIYPVLLIRKTRNLDALLIYIFIFLSLQTCNITTQFYDFNFAIAYLAILLINTSKERRLLYYKR